MPESPDYLGNHSAVATLQQSPPRVAITLSFGSICWLLLWAGINTGPWNLDFDYITSGWTDALNGIRAAFPPAIVGVWLYHLFLTQHARTRILSLAELLWLWYAMVCILSGCYAEPWLAYEYWGLAYVAVFAAIDIFMRGRPPMRRATELNLLSWLCCSAVLVAVVFLARGKLLAETSMGISGYGVLERMPTVAGMTMVRATGISRLAAILAIVAFVVMWESRGYTRLGGALGFAAAFYLVWVMQSRGSTVSLGLATAVVMVLLGGRARIVGWTLITVVGLVWALGFIPSDTVHYLFRYATRGTQGRELASMSGRTQIFHEAWKKILESPWIGNGPQADRQLAQVGNAQNGLLYALLCSGFVGAAGYAAGLVVSWTMLLRTLASRNRMRRSERRMLLQIAGIMTFLTLRSYPENCAAVYGVDLLVQLPAIVYIGELYRVLVRTNFVWQARSVVAPSPAVGMVHASALH
jgi:O-antigen ligase